MEGQTHTRTCSPAVHAHALMHLFVHSVCIHSNICGHTLHRPVSLAVDTSGASHQHRPCSLILPSCPLTIRPPPFQRKKKKVARNSLSPPPLLAICLDSLLLCDCFYVSLELFSMRLYFKHNCQATGVRMKLYYSQIIDQWKQRSTVRV